MGPKLNVYELVHLVNDITTLLICEVLHGFLSFEKLALKNRVDLFACTKYGIDGVVAG